jgi:hypothetical protein
MLKYEYVDAFNIPTRWSHLSSQLSSSGRINDATTAAMVGLAVSVFTGEQATADDFYQACASKIRYIQSSVVNTHTDFNASSKLMSILATQAVRSAVKHAEATPATAASSTARASDDATSVLTSFVQSYFPLVTGDSIITRTGTSTHLDRLDSFILHHQPTSLSGSPQTFAYSKLKVLLEVLSNMSTISQTAKEDTLANIALSYCETLVAMCLTWVEETLHDSYAELGGIMYTTLSFLCTSCQSHLDFDRWSILNVSKRDGNRSMSDHAELSMRYAQEASTIFDEITAQPTSEYLHVFHCAIILHRYQVSTLVDVPREAPCPVIADWLIVANKAIHNLPRFRQLWHDSFIIIMDQVCDWLVFHGARLDAANVYTSLSRCCTGESTLVKWLNGKASWLLLSEDVQLSETDHSQPQWSHTMLNDTLSLYLQICALRKQVYGASSILQIQKILREIYELHGLISRASEASSDYTRASLVWLASLACFCISEALLRLGYLETSLNKLMEGYKASKTAALLHSRWLQSSTYAKLDEPHSLVAHMMLTRCSEFQAECLQSISDIHDAMGNYKKAFKFCEEAIRAVWLGYRGIQSKSLEDVAMLTTQTTEQPDTPFRVRQMLRQLLELTAKKSHINEIRQWQSSRSGTVVFQQCRDGLLVDRLEHVFNKAAGKSDKLT